MPKYEAPNADANAINNITINEIIIQVKLCFTFTKLKVIFKISNLIGELSLILPTREIISPKKLGKIRNAKTCTIVNKEVQKERNLYFGFNSLNILSIIFELFK